MKTVSVALVLLALLPAPRALAHAHDGDSPRLHSNCCDPPSRWGPRHDTHSARLAITTEDGDATLVLTDDLVAIQLSDRNMHKVDRKLRQAQHEDEDNALAGAIKSAVISGVRDLLDHSAECAIRDLRSVEYDHGRLVLTTEDGDEVFSHFDVNDQDVMEGFGERDARLFVREFRRLKARQP